nr:unnamed protein product [Digitaria exilis]
MDAVVRALPSKLAALLVGDRDDDDVVFLKSELRSMWDHLDSRTSHDDGADDDLALERKVAYDVEDCLDLLGGGGGEPSSSRRLVKWLFLRDAHKLRTLQQRYSMSAKEVQELKQRVVVLRERRRERCSAAVDDDYSQAQQHSAMLVDPGGDVVGLDGPIEEVGNMVMDAGEKAELQIVSIVGMAGSGKTTLAKEVYRRLKEQNYFTCCAFASVLPDLSKTFMDMLLGLKFTSVHHVDDDTHGGELIEMIRETLSKERYLIVVDDLWGRGQWKEIRCCFPENSLGSRVIITARNLALAKECSGSIYNIPLLSEINSRKLILNRAFGTRNGRPPKGWEDFLAQIVGRCGGLPLALVTLVSMLTEQSSMDEWERLIGSIWLSTSHPYAEMMKQKLNLSYSDLPSRQHKKCLLYLSIFPENYKVDIRRLVRLWIAERFIPEGFVPIIISEETAIRMYLTDLIARDMVQPLHQKHYEEFPRYCRVHPVIHDFIVWKSVEQKFIIMMNVQNQEYSPNSYGAVRRLSLRSNINRDEAVAQNDSTDLSRVRSITVFGQGIATPHLTRLKMVRVLDLEDCDSPVCLDGLSKLIYLRSTKVKELPPSICKLLHLRYLNLRDTAVSELPMTIGELRCLETLDARSTKVKVLPPSIVHLNHTLKTLQGLMKFKVTLGSVKMTVEAVNKEVAKHHNPINLIINGTTVNVNGVREKEEATEIYNEAKCEGEAKYDVKVVGERTRRITSEIEEIEDDTESSP